MTASELRAIFAQPPSRYRPVPFWWWVGEPLDRARLLWQLDELRREGVHGAIISYNHFTDGRNNPGEPAVFSPEWWDLLRWLLGECRARDMFLGFQDYTLVNPILAEIGRATPDMAGSGSLEEIHAHVRDQQTVELAVPAGGRPLVAIAYRREATVTEKNVLSISLEERVLRWTAPEGEWLVSLVWVRPADFDPMHPASGAKAIERLYAPFVRECSGEVGRTLTIFFQDELDFGSRMPLWSERLAAEFTAAHGYPLVENLPALWHDLDTRSVKLRIDYSDTVTRLLERHYFIPVFEWHERHGTLWGHDNAGRGAIGTGRRYYGDYFRTMRWYSAPGSDDPQLRRPRAFAGLKVNSSIAQLYGRPRVWVEAFHSSGWGASPADIVRGINEDFVLGANFVNLHGLYYTTFGSWWEWAAPDFHFRQPYWLAGRVMNDYLARLSAVLSQGVHVCDTAMLYPITALEGGLNRGATSEGHLALSLSEEQRAENEPPIDPAEVTAFQFGRGLVEAGGDFDFVDFESVERAEIRDGHLCVAGGRYRTLVLPRMTTIRFRTLQRLLEFHRAGGRVLAIGALPIASDRQGANDPEVRRIVEEIFESATFARDSVAALSALLESTEPNDFDPAGTGWQALHRRAGGLDLYLVRNPQSQTIRGHVSLRAHGRCEIWDAWSGQTKPVHATRISHGTEVELELAAGEAALVVFDSTVPPITGLVRGEQKLLCALPAEDWEFELVPTLDNRHGDFRRPPSPRLLGAEARRFRHRATPPCDLAPMRANYDDTTWPVVSASVGPQFWKLGPLPAAVLGGPHEASLRQLTDVNPAVPVEIDGRSWHWAPYEFSRETGIERDPFMLDWRSGPHGLKNTVPDEFIDLTTDRAGDVWYLWTTLDMRQPGPTPLVAGSRSAFAVWLNGAAALERKEALPPGIHPAWNLPFYESEPLHASVALAQGPNPLLLRLQQPAGQRLRAYVALDAPPASDRPALRWFAHSPSWQFNPSPSSRKHAAWYRFSAPPGMTGFRVPIRGTVEAWCDEQSLHVVRTRRTEEGISHYMITAAMAQPRTAAIALRVQPEPGSFGGDTIAGPVEFECGAGRVDLGDWCAHGLATYSGAAWYRRWVELPESAPDAALQIDLGDVRAVAEVWWNGQRCGTRVCAPWNFALVGPIKSGANRLEIKVANTLANHYSEGVPTPYNFPEQCVSGLLGPVRIFSS